MSYLITAWLEQGEPRLGIVSEQTGTLKHQWRLNKIVSEHDEPQWRAHHRAERSGIQHLVRQLFLIGCAEEISLAQRARAGNMSDSCLACGVCLEQAEPAGAAPLIYRYAKEERRSGQDVAQPRNPATFLQSS